MTDLQIKYQNLLLDRDRVAKELALNERQIKETERHNLANEALGQEQNRIAWHQAESARMNSETNRMNYAVNAYNADTNRMNAETNRLNYQVNAWNAQTNAQNAATNAYLASLQAQRVALEKEKQGYEIQLLKAQTSTQYEQAAYIKQQTADLTAKFVSGYWNAQSDYYTARTATEKAAALDTIAKLVSGYWPNQARLTQAQVQDYLDKNESKYWKTAAQSNTAKAGSSWINSAISFAKAFGFGADALKTYSGATAYGTSTTAAASSVYTTATATASGSAWTAGASFSGMGGGAGGGIWGHTERVWEIH